MTKFYTNAIEYGNNILVRGYDRGRPFNEKIPYQPSLFLPSKRKDLAVWKDIVGNTLDPMQFDSMRDAKEFIKRYEDVSNFKLYGMPRFLYAYLNDEYPNEIAYDRELINVAYIDIEVSSEFGFPTVERASDTVTAITLKKDGIFHVWGFGDFKSNRKDVQYYQCNNEKELLFKFLSEWSLNYPDIVTGWNVTFFDIPYLVRRMSTVLGESEAKRFSPWRIIKERRVRTKFKEETVYNIGGVATLDYLEMYQKFTYTQQESYKLDHIAFVELGERKLSYDEYETLHEFYMNDFQRFIEYNIRDVELVEKLDDKMKLIDMALALAYDAKVTLMDVFTQVRMWDVIIHNHLHKQNIAVPIEGGGSKDEAYVGAFVKEPKPGGYDWVMSFDLNSLYPHLIMQYNISPETLLRDGRNRAVKIDVTVDELLDGHVPEVPEGYGLAANGCFFSKARQGFLPEIMERMYNDRVVYKNKMIEAQKKYEATKDKQAAKDISRYKNMQLAKKVQLNSAYGAIGNPHFRFFDINQATAITLGGQLSIRWAENEMNKYLNRLLKTKDTDYVIASDTDSLYISFDRLVQMVFDGRGSKQSDPAVQKQKIVDFLDKVAREKIEPVIDGIYSDLAVRMEAFAQKMNMKREVIADRGIWTAKKRYILNVHDSEGVRYAKPKLKIMGIEAVKSSTPAVCRQAIIDALNIIMSKDEEDLHKFIADFKSKFYKLNFEEVAFPRSVQDLTKYAKETKSIPIHVRGALLYNNLIKKLNLQKKYELIKDGEKIRFSYLKMPNPARDNVICAFSALPSEFNLEEYIDYDTQFEKAFMAPLNSILEVIDWHSEKRSSLEDFFS
jgi:DNA polymerase elongation subunit (family B)